MDTLVSDCLLLYSTFLLGLLEPVTNQSEETLEILVENDDNSDKNEKNLAKNDEKIKEKTTPISSSTISNILNERKCPECNFEFAKSRDLFQHLIGKNEICLKKIGLVHPKFSISRGKNYCFFVK